MRLLAKILGITLLVAGAACAHCDATLKIGSHAPAIKVSKWLKGPPVPSFKKGHIYVVEFWATWCVPCKASMPHLSEMARKLRGKVTFIGVSACENDPSKVQPFVNQMGDKMDFSIATDAQVNPTTREGFMSKHWMAASDQPAMPVAFVIGRDTKIQWIGQPMLGLEDILNKVVANKFDAKAYAAKVAAQAADQRKAHDAWLKNPVQIQISKVEKLIESKSYDKAIIESKALEHMSGTGLPVEPAEVAITLRLQVFQLKGDMDGYYTSANQSFEAHKNDETILSKIAWNIVDPDSDLERKDFDFALKVALRSAELGKRKKPGTLDTLAWAYFASGDKVKAIACEKEAIALTPADQQADFIATLKKFGG